MDRAEYEAAATRFNPTEYDPEDWVLLAKSAGMKYICFTAKHHDGFCMWDTAYTDYKITNTPYGKDTLKMLADACKKHGMKLSIYYSNPDWHYEYGYNPNSTHQWCAVNQDAPNIPRLIEFIKNQITELMTNYGEIYTLFWDIPANIDDPSINELVRRLQPNIFINDRGFCGGDFSTPERDYEALSGGRFTTATEACNSVGENSWGYRYDEDFFSVRYLRSAIDRVMAMGGSYLLNVGPTAKGTIAPEYRERIEAVGEWYNRMEGCLEENEAESFDYEVHKNECIVNKKNGKTYFHFYNGLISTQVSFKKWHSTPKTVRLMNTGEELEAAVRTLPLLYYGENRTFPELLQIRGIPIDKLASEPIVIEIEWN
jgi:alpha-L-fucosidase